MRKNNFGNSKVKINSNSVKKSQFHQKKVIDPTQNPPNKIFTSPSLEKPASRRAVFATKNHHSDRDSIQ